jgi:serine/threonine-protein kinase
MQLPVLFGKYQLEKFLGGGMSQVYKATDTVLGRTVAVKILTDDGCRDEDTKKRFLVEARMSGNIVHDNIIRIHDYGEIDGRPYIVMEFLTGEDLRGAIDSGRTGDLKHKLHIALQAAKALGYVHSKNIVHRDIKPENLHIDESGRVRLMDFGIAKAQNLNLTREGFAVGTPYYMAPEQVLGKPVTPAADVYSFGILLYELLTGIKPVVGETVESLFYLILHQPLNLEPLQQAGIPPDLINLISVWTSKKPEDRPAGFDAVISGLELILGQLDGTRRPTQQQPVPPPPPPVEQSKSKMPLIAVGGALAVALVILAVVFYPKNDPVPKKDDVGKKEEVKGPPQRIADDFGEMILVPAGKFVSGTGADTKTKDLPAFYMDKTEVSVSAWNKFAQKMGRQPQDVRGDFPVVNVNFADATEYCTWAQKHIPTADEWEKAARGADGRIYPWGHEPDSAKANVQGNPNLTPGQPQPVDSLPDGATPSGLLHMAGNVWEWVRDARKPTPEILKLYAKHNAKMDEPWTTMRGGGFDFDIRGAVAHEFQTVPERIAGKSIGFRCAKDVPAQ